PLQLRLELTRARVGRLVQETALRVARLELGRRVGARGAVDAAPLDTVPAPELPLTLPEAVTQAASEGPQYRVARANERAAGAAFRAKLGQYLPHASLTFNALAYDTVFFHSIYKRGTFTLGVSFPLWDNGQREIALSQARVNRDNARAVREDLERAVLHDVTAAYEGYTAAGACKKGKAGGPDPAGGGGGGAPMGMPVEVVVARTDTVRDEIAATGQIEAVQSIDLRPEVDGRIVEILIREGQEVEQGTPLFKVDDAQLKAQVAQLEAQRDLA